MSIFNSKIPIFAPSRNKFDLGHERKMSMNMGKLVPILCQHVIPGDSFKVNSQIFVRFAPMIAPVMHRVNVNTHYFFVPYRILWAEWEKFITGGDYGAAAPVFPTVRITAPAGTNPPTVEQTWGLGSLADYLGVPTYSGVAIPTNPLDISALPFRAYTKIYDDYYRDQNLEPSLDVKTTSGDQTLTDPDEVNKITQLRTRAYEKDYFTTALPWPQKAPDVQIPGTEIFRATRGDNGNPFPASAGIGTDAGANLIDVASGAGLVLKDGIGNSINDLRKAFKLQEWFEKQARGGSRYIETILSHFRVKSSDARLQRSEYLGGGQQHVTISEVLQTIDQTATDFPLGTMGGHGVSSGNSNGFTRSFEEHGVIIGIMSVLPKSAYQQGLDKHWRKFDKFDHYWPSFANLGEQEVKLHELYYKTDDPAGHADKTFGYQSRYAEYKHQFDSVHGDFRENLAFWHMGRIFGSEPALNNAFIKAEHTDGMDRIFAVQDPATHNIWVQLYNSVSALRPMPYHSTPSI
ncbi:MAG: major capsid protein [Microvirus sp.]|nr:MAG: major capsid protein [Microvirus sp.]